MPMDSSAAGLVDCCGSEVRGDYLRGVADSEKDQDRCHQSTPAHAGYPHECANDECSYCRPDVYDVHKDGSDGQQMRCAKRHVCSSADIRRCSCRLAVIRAKAIDVCAEQV